MPTHLAFRPDVEGRFVDRPNRFVVRVDIGGQTIEAHCPNPGRMTELLFPGTTVLLERAPAGRKLAYTLVAVQRPGPGGVTTIPLASARANAAVGALVVPRMFPSATVVKAEHTLGTSRFDWYVEDADGKHLVEVKACSEVEYDIALFPDAPSLRAVKHLEELAHWAAEGYHSHVVFAVVHGRPTSFRPNIHTDIVFTRALAALSPRLALHAVVFETAPDGNTRWIDNVPVDLSSVPRADAPDAGLLVRLTNDAGHWAIAVEAYPHGWSKAVSQAPARQSFSLNVDPRRRDKLAEELAAAAGTDDTADPRTKKLIVDTILRWRHTIA
jgi:sugar fermentation stimulation protein